MKIELINKSNSSHKTTTKHDSTYYTNRYIELLEMNYELLKKENECKQELINSFMDGSITAVTKNRNVRIIKFSYQKQELNKLMGGR